MKSLDTEYETLALDEATPGVVVVTLNRAARLSHRRPNSGSVSPR